MSLTGGAKSDVTPSRVLHRISIYYRYLQYLDESGVERVSSTELASKSGVTASQLRQDLHYFGSFGQQGYGYRVDELLTRIKRIMGLDRTQTMVIVGAGRLGLALASYGSFPRRGFRLAGIYDTDPASVGASVGGVTIGDISELGDFLVANEVDIGVITVPASSAQPVADSLVKGGVDAIWNFAPVRLAVPLHVTVEHIHLTDSLVALAFAAKLNREQSPAEGDISD